MSENKASFVGMEEEDNTPCRPCHSPHKRRSTLYRRRSTLQAQDKNGSQNFLNNDKPDTIMIDRVENTNSDNILRIKNNESHFDLQKYIDDLKEERKLWKETLMDRKRQRKIISKQMSNIKQSGEQDLDLSALSETDRNFLLKRPNYEHICEKAKKLSVMAAESLILNNHIIHLQKRRMYRAEKKLDDLTKRIIKLID